MSNDDPVVPSQDASKTHVAMDDAAAVERELDAVFGEAGALASVVPGYAPRAPQREMAAAVAQAIARAETLVVEAGTGVGKTLAYLVPALLSGRRVVISTGTRNLQDQLFHRDLPSVTAAIGQPVRTALLKGRSNYLCRYRLGQARTTALRPDVDAAVMKVAGWALDTRDGDVAEVRGLGEDHAVWPHVTSTADNCLGQDCPEYADCYVVKARRRAQRAELVVVNHHLLLADFTLKEEGFGELLPGAEACIVDEAHQLPDIATRFFGVRLSARQITGTLSDLERELGDIQTDVTVVRDAALPVRDAAAAFRSTLGRYERRLNFAELTPKAREALTALDEALTHLADLLEPLDGHSAGLDAVRRRLVLMTQALERATDDDEASVRWVEVFRAGFALHSTPLDAADPLRDMMQRQDAAWILTSATLAVQDRFDHFVERSGLVSPRTLKLGSPFDFERNAVLYLPRELPPPSDRSYTSNVLELARPLIDAAGGSAFVLFTSRRALREAADAWQDRLPYAVLAQGDAPRDELLRQFRAHGNAVLLGNASFWEGVDVRGDALTLVIIDKLPFASPGDPVTEARLQALKRNGVNAFMQHQVPEAVISLKQGVGRLIRDPADQGVCVICDPRVTQKAYGRVFRNSLPPMRVTHDAADAIGFLKTIRGDKSA